jgi:hypothetical protein
MDIKAERENIEKFDPEEKEYCSRLLDIIERTQKRNDWLIEGKCMGCGKHIDHHYCQRCLKLWES